MRDDGIQPSLLKVIEAKQMKTKLNHNTTRHKNGDKGGMRF